MIKLGKDLEIGDVILKPYQYIIIDIDKEGVKPFWDGKPSYGMYDLNDSYYGPCEGELDLDAEFEVATTRKEIVRAYNIVNCDLAEHIADLVEQRRNFASLQMKVLMGIND